MASKTYADRVLVCRLVGLSLRVIDPFHGSRGLGLNRSVQL
ncbi:MAG TPA: hypothetical protein VNQ81_01725 [Povalibacter sp.]|nr:hypothetical protein [Povalibacter sp.]